MATALQNKEQVAIYVEPYVEPVMQSWPALNFSRFQGMDMPEMFPVRGRSPARHGARSQGAPQWHANAMHKH